MLHTNPKHLHQKNTSGSVQSKQNLSKTKDTSTSTRQCRCPPKQSSSTSSTSVSTASGPSKSTKSTATVGTSVNTAVASILRNPKDLPVRDYEKLSPIPSANFSNSAKSSISSSTSNMLDALIASNNGISIGVDDDGNALGAAIINKSVLGNNSSNSNGNHKTLALNKVNSSTSTNNQIEDVIKTIDDQSNADNIEMINLNLFNNKHIKKLSQQPQCNNSSKHHNISNNSKNVKNIDVIRKETVNSSSDKDNSYGTSGKCSNSRYVRAISNDDTLILRICDLEYTTKRTSLSSASSSTSSSASNPNAKLNKTTRSGAIGKTKVRTKTDPHPISSPQKQRRQTSATTSTMTSTSTVNLNQYHKCSPRMGNSKCNCSSCCATTKTSLITSSSDNHNRTKSVGTQHDANNPFDPWIKQNTIPKSTSKQQKQSLEQHYRHQSSQTSSSVLQKLAISQKLINSNAKVIVITDDFKKKALNQEVLIDTKRKILRYMKANKLMGSSRSMDDVRIGTDASGENTSSDDNNGGHDKGANISSSQKASAKDTDKSTNMKKNKTKAISKSVDNVSILSTEMDALDNVGSVELIFISDEFLNEVSSQDVIVLKRNSKIPQNLMRSKQHTINGSSMDYVDNGTGATNNKSQLRSVVSIETGAIQVDGEMSSAKTSNKKQIIVVSDNFRRKSLKNKKIVIIDEPKRRPGKLSNNHPKLSRQSSGESSIDDVNNKITSHAFQSYDEASEDLESKEIQSPVIEEFIL